MTEPPLSPSSAMAPLLEVAAQMRVMAPDLRTQADELPDTVHGSAELATQFRALLRDFGTTSEQLADRVDTFAATYSRHLPVDNSDAEAVQSPALPPLQNRSCWPSSEGSDG